MRDPLDLPLPRRYRDVDLGSKHRCQL